MGNKIISAVFLLYLLFSVFTGWIYADNNLIAQGAAAQGKAAVGADIPGVTCGNAEAVDPQMRVCCRKVEIADDNSFFSVLASLGQAGAFIANLRNAALQTYRSVQMIPCPIGTPSNPADPNTNCTCVKQSDITPIPIQQVGEMCDTYFRSSDVQNERNSCHSCATSGGVWTSIGCMSGDIRILIEQKILGWGIGLAGGFALLCIIYSAFMMQTSQGNPEALKKAQQNLTSCIFGLIFIIFSVFILRAIGVDILRIPGFGK